MPKLKKLCWYGTFSAGQGYSGSSEQTALALERNGVDVRVVSFNKVPAKNVSAAGRKLKKKPFEMADVAVCHGFPVAFSSIQNHKFRVGYTMFETDKLPDGYTNWTGPWASPADAINKQLDLLMVPCQHNVEMFKENGITVPIEIAPNAVHPTAFPYMDRPRRKTFTFLMMATLTIRKNPGAVISAFAQLFRDIPEARLVLKTQSGTLGAVQFNGMGNIEIIDELYNLDQMKQLMYEADCFVFPSRGEGFGMPPIEAMATGLPTIVAANTGMLDYSDDRYNYTVKHSHMSPAIRYPRDWGDVGNWYEPDFEDLKAKMLHVFQNQAEARQKGDAASEWVHSEWNYDVVAKRFIDAIEKHNKALQ